MDHLPEDQSLLRHAWQRAGSILIIQYVDTLKDDAKRAVVLCMQPSKASLSGNLNEKYRTVVQHSTAYQVLTQTLRSLRGIGCKRATVERMLAQLHIVSLNDQAYFRKVCIDHVHDLARALTVAPGNDQETFCTLAPAGMQRILDQLPEFGKNSVFMDIGLGMGNAALHAAFVSGGYAFGCECAQLRAKQASELFCDLMRFQPEYVLNHRYTVIYGSFFEFLPPQFVTHLYVFDSAFSAIEYQRLLHFIACMRRCKYVVLFKAQAQKGTWLNFALKVINAKVLHEFGALPFANSSNTRSAVLLERDLSECPMDCPDQRPPLQCMAARVKEYGVTRDSILKAHYKLVDDLVRRPTQRTIKAPLRYAPGARYPPKMRTVRCRAMEDIECESTSCSTCAKYFHSFTPWLLRKNESGLTYPAYTIFSKDLIARVEDASVFVAPSSTPNVVLREVTRQCDGKAWWFACGSKDVPENQELTVSVSDWEKLKYMASSDSDNSEAIPDLVPRASHVPSPPTRRGPRSSLVTTPYSRGIPSVSPITTHQRENILLIGVPMPDEAKPFKLHEEICLSMMGRKIAMHSSTETTLYTISHKYQIAHANDNHFEINWTRVEDIKKVINQLSKKMFHQIELIIDDFPDTQSITNFCTNFLPQLCQHNILEIGGKIILPLFLRIASAIVDITLDADYTLRFVTYDEAKTMSRWMDASAQMPNHEKRVGMMGIHRTSLRESHGEIIRKIEGRWRDVDFQSARMIILCRKQ